MNKRNIALCLFLLLQIVIIGYVYRPGQKAEQPSIRFLEGTTPDQVTGLSIADRENRTLTLEKGERKWVISSKEDIPADQEKVESLVNKLTALQSSRLITKTESSHERLKVGKSFNKKVTIHMQDGDDRILYLGTAPSYKTLHVRADNDNNVYLVNDFSSWETEVEPSSWWKNRYMDIASAEVTEITLANRHGSFSLRKKDTAGQWQLADAKTGDQVDETAVLDFIDGVNRISVTEYLGKEEREEYGLTKPSAEVTLKNPHESEPVRVTVGREDEETGSYVVKASTSPFYVRAGKYSVAPLIEQKPEDLLAEQTEPNKKTEM